MRLHSRQFEKALRRAVLRTVRASPQLKREFRIANKKRKHYSLGIVARPALCLLLAMLVWRIGGQGQPIQSALAIMALWTFGLLFFQAGRLLTCLFSSPDLPALSVLPIEGQTVFRWEFQKFLRSSIWVFADVLLGCAALALLHDFSFAKWLAIFPIALLAWLQYRLWFGNGGAREVAALEQQVAQQKRQNAGLRERNAALAAEVADLTSGEAAIEARARGALGMIKPGDTG